MSNMRQGSVPDLTAKPPAVQPVLPPMKPLTLTDHAALLATAAASMQTATATLLDLARARQEPPEVRVISLAAPGLPVTDKSQWEARSIGLMNTCPVVVYIGLGGASATLAGRGLPVPPNTLMIWPARDYDVEVGADPSAPLAATAVLFLMRFNALQAPFLGKGA